MLDRELQGAGQLTMELDAAPQEYFAGQPKEGGGRETAKERKRKHLLARTEKWLTRRDKVMAKLHSRIGSPNRSDLSIKTWRLWEKIGQMNLLLRKLDQELLDLRNGEEEERRGKETYQGRIPGNDPKAVQ